MALRHGDLKDTVLDRISIDEFEPKTGEVEDTMVVGFYVTDGNVGQDLYDFLTNTFDYIRDIEISPNPNNDGYYMVFIEIGRNEHAPKHIKRIVSDVTNVTGKLAWRGRSHLTDEYFPLDSEELWQYVITDPDNYMTRKEFEAHQAQEKLAQEAKELAVREAQEQQDNSDRILKFLEASNLLRAGINDGRLHMQDARNVMTLEIVDFGPADEVMSRHGIHEAAINTEFDRTVFTKLKSMLGDISAMPIGEHVVMYNPQHKEAVLITKTV